LSEASPDAKKELVLTDLNGSSFGPTIKAQLDQERARKTSLEARGIGIVTTSGVLATLLFGLVTLTRGSTFVHLEIGPTGKTALMIGVVLFGVAAFLGLSANLPLSYQEMNSEEMEHRVSPQDWFNTRPVEAARRDAKWNYEVIASERRMNEFKAWLVFAGITSEGLAVVAVALAVLAELWRLTPK
jgi:hypothetical protein